jgi:hypothetical protein
LGNSHALEHALGELSQLHPLNVLEAHALQGGLDAAGAIFGGNSGELRVVVQQFMRGEVVVEIGLLGKKADERFHFGIGPYLPEDAS